MNKRIKFISQKDKKDLIFFLKKNHNFKLTKKKYDSLFSTQWTKNKTLGIIIKHKNKIVGFFGLLFSDNNFYNNSKINIVNVHTWVVKKKFRYLSLELIKELNKINGILISHSSLIELKNIFFKFGWKVLDEYFFLIPINFFNTSNLIYHFRFPRQIKIKKILIDHIKTGSKFICFKINNKNLIMLFNIRKKFIFLLSEVIYTNDLNLFNRHIKAISAILYKEFNIFFLKIDARFINQENIKIYKKYKFKYKTHLKLLKNNSKITLKNSKLNNLYSEFQLI